MEPESCVISNALLDDYFFDQNFVKDDTDETSLDIFDNDDKSTKYTHLNVCSTLTSSTEKLLGNIKAKSVEHGGYSSNTDYFPFITELPDTSYLQRYEEHFEEFIKDKVPTLFVRDILKAKKYIIDKKLTCKHLYVVKNIIFNYATCRGTVIGISDTNTSKLIIDDGTGRISCLLNKDKIKNNVDNLPIIEGFNCTALTCQPVIFPFNIERGSIVQIKGTLNMCKNKKKIMICKICKESEVSIAREIQYLDYVNVMYKSYEE